MILIKQGEVFAPEAKGVRDVLLAGGRIMAVDTRIEVPADWDVDVVDGRGLKLVPGLIDGHAHISGAGGEGGPATRTPELQLSHFLTGGVTTAIGCLGTDGFTRNIEALVMKAKGLKQDGLSCWVYTGSYQVPTPTLTGDVARDLCFVEEILGAGEIALADHRSSSPTVHELVRLAKHLRIGGMLSGKAGILHLHLGDGRFPFEQIYAAVAQSELHFNQFQPTHINRNPHCFEEAKAYGKKGWLDITTSSYPYFTEEEIKPSKAVVGLLEAGVPAAHITMSSDAGGSLPQFDEEGNLCRVEVGMPDANLRELRDLVLEEKLDLTIAIQLLTANPARVLKLARKGRLAPGYDADLLALDDDFEVCHLIAGGTWMVKNGELCRRGTFESVQ